MKLILKVILSLIAIICASQYFMSVRHREQAYDCEQEKSYFNYYIGEICYLPYRNGTLFRIYNEKTHELLAERTYSDLSPQIVFSNDRVIYSIDAEKQDAYVPLPPTWLDRLRAKLQ